MDVSLFGIANLGLYLSLIILIGLIVVGVPIPLCFAATLAFFVYTYNIDVGAQLPMGFRKMSSLTFLAVPFFILAGEFMTSTGVAERIIKISNALVGRVKGGLGASTVVACAITGSIAGTCSAAVAAIGAIMIPAMEKEGYPRGYSTGLVACASVLGQLIPPSVPMILYAFVAKVSVLACFLSSVGPGVLLVVIYITINRFLAAKMPSVKVMPSIGFRNQVKEIGNSMRYGFFALMMPVILLGGIYGGIMTCTEAAATAVIYVMFIGIFVYKTLKWKTIYETFSSAGVTTGVILLMTFFVILLSRTQTMLNIPQGIIATFTGISENRYVVLLMVNIFLIILGMLVDDFTGTLLAAPLLLPLMMHIGVHPIQFAAILGTNLGLGNVTPPVAPILYLAARIGNISVDKMIKPASYYMMFGTIPVVLATTYWPALSLTLPTLVFPKYMAMAFGG